MSLVLKSFLSRNNISNKILPNALTIKSNIDIHLRGHNKFHKNIRTYSKFLNELSLRTKNFNKEISLYHTLNLLRIPKYTSNDEYLFPMNSPFPISTKCSSVILSKRHYSNKSNKKNNVKCKFPDSILFTSESVGEGHPGNIFSMFHIFFRFYSILFYFIFFFFFFYFIFFFFFFFSIYILFLLIL